MGSFGVVTGISIASAYDGVSLTNLSEAAAASDESLTNLGEAAAASDESRTNLGGAGAASVKAPMTAPKPPILASSEIESAACTVHVCAALVDAASALITSDGLR